MGRKLSNAAASQLNRAGFATHKIARRAKRDRDLAAKRRRLYR